MRVTLTDESRDELRGLPPAEKKAMIHAIDKLEVAGDLLEFPHSSAVKGAQAPLRELRPRRGRSPWRAFYRRVGTRIVVAAIGPEAQVDPRGFDRAVAEALTRLANVPDGEETDG